MLGPSSSHTEPVHDAHPCAAGDKPPDRSEKPPNAFVARQPIFDRNQRVVAYELLFRASRVSSTFDVPEGVDPTSVLIANSVFAIGMGNLLAGKWGFVNFSRGDLLGDQAGSLSPKTTVIEVLESVPEDDEVVEACRRLKAQGYQIALDDFVAGDTRHRLMELADIIKVDFRATAPSEQRALAQRFRGGGIRLLAEKVESAGEFEHGRRLGYTLFQGYFFARPETIAARKLPAFKQHYHRLLCALHQADFDYESLESIIKQELSLVYKLLRYLNSARFGWNGKIKSVRHALVLLGAQEVRTWVSLAIVTGLGDDKPAALVMTAMIRARLCELIGRLARLADRQDHAFLMGMFSAMDAIMDRPLAEVLAGLEIHGEVRAALLGTAGEGSKFGAVYSLVRGYEVGDWDAVARDAKRLGIAEASLPPLYAEAIEWAEDVFTH
jgi:EAL and modified HD-GYP domain-containing signal transduction protein